MFLEHYEAVPRQQRKLLTSIFKANAKQLDVGYFLMHLGSYLQAGIPLLAALDTIADTTKSKPMQRDVREIIILVSSGNTLSDAIRKLPNFPGYVYTVLSVAEKTGNYAEALKDLALMILEQSKFRQEIKRRMRYPLFLLCMFVMLMFLACECLLPEIISWTKAMDIKNLPCQTRILIAFSDFVKNNTALFWSGILLFFLCIFYFLSLCGRVTVMARLMLYFPVLGGLKRKTEVCRFYHLLGFMLSAKVPLRHALDIAKSLPTNLFLQKTIARCCQAVTAGQKLSTAFSDNLVTTPIIHQALLLGDQVGDTSTPLSKAVAFEQLNLKNKIEDIIRMLEPISICMMGAVFVWIIISLFAPLYMNLEF